MSPLCKIPYLHFSCTPRGYAANCRVKREEEEEQIKNEICHYTTLLQSRMRDVDRLHADTRALEQEYRELCAELGLVGDERLLGTSSSSRRKVEESQAG